MKIEFTKEEYRKLLDLLFLGEMIVPASYDEEALKKGDSSYKDICQKIYSRAAELGLEKLMEFDKETEEYWPSRYFEDTSSALEMFKEHTDDSFWDELAARLADRDLCKDIGEKKRAKLDPMKYIELSHPLREKYYEEFSENGLDNLKVAPQS